MTTAPLPGFLPAAALSEFERFEGPLIYLAVPLGHRWSTTVTPENDN